MFTPSTTATLQSLLDKALAAASSATSPDEQAVSNVIDGALNPYRKEILLAVIDWAPPVAA
jgi:hypothetical protein